MRTHARTSYSHTFPFSSLHTVRSLVRDVAREDGSLRGPATTKLHQLDGANDQLVGNCVLRLKLNAASAPRHDPVAFGLARAPTTTSNPPPAAHPPPAARAPDKCHQAEDGIAVNSPIIGVGGAMFSRASNPDVPVDPRVPPLRRRASASHGQDHDSTGLARPPNGGPPGQGRRGRRALLICWGGCIRDFWGARGDRAWREAPVRSLFSLSEDESNGARFFRSRLALMR